MLATLTYLLSGTVLLVALVTRVAAWQAHTDPLAPWQLLGLLVGAGIAVRLRL